MKRIIYYILVFFIYACGSKDSQNKNESHNINSKYTDYEKIFYQVDSLLKIDNSKFWNYKIYGPILFIDPDTREFVANQNNDNDDFKKIGNVFVDTLPNDLNIANTAINWDKERWVMAMTPLPNNIDIRNNLIIHELFHRIQPNIGFDSLIEESNNHLDSYEGRLLLKLELEALKNALKAENRESSIQHIKNALNFRSTRQSDNTKKVSENSLEINEGLAEFTGVMLSGRTDKDITAHFIENINLFYHNKTFVRSFAYQTIPIYGYLLAKNKPNWQLEINNKTMLTDYFIYAFSIQLSEETDYEVIATENDYDYHKIVEEEKERENQRLVKIAAYKKVFIEGTTLELPFRNMNISFDPSNITPLEDYGTVYPTIRVTDDWGILTVEEGALLSPIWSGITVSKPTKINIEIVEGVGWKLELAEGWKVEKSGESFKLKEK